jgi:hypothetical protein
LDQEQVLRAETLFFIRRCTPQVVLHHLALRWKRARMAVMSMLSRLPLTGSVVRRFFLTEHLSLLKGEQQGFHGFGKIELEEQPASLAIARSHFPQVFERYAGWIRLDPFGLAGYPLLESRIKERGGLTWAEVPEPAIVYLPPRRFQTVLRDGFRNMVHGGLITSDGTMVLECANAGRRTPRLQAIFLYGQRKPRRAPYLEGLSASLEGRWAETNYYHWLIDGLTKIDWLIKAAEGRPVNLLVSPGIPDAWLSLLKLLIPDEFTIKRLDGWVQMEQFLLLSPSRVQPAPWLAEDERNFIRSAVFRHFGLDPNHVGTRRIHISRSDALTRRLVNEVEVIDTLNAFDIETIKLEKLSIEQQIRLFHDTSFVTGVHGAGYANLLFAGQTNVLEYFPASEFKPMYFFLAHCLGQDYHFLEGGPASRLKDFHLDISVLHKTLAALLKRSSVRRFV